MPRSFFILSCITVMNVFCFKKIVLKFIRVEKYSVVLKIYVYLKLVKKTKSAGAI